MNANEKDSILFKQVIRTAAYGWLIALFVLLATDVQAENGSIIRPSSYSLQTSDPNNSQLNSDTTSPTNPDRSPQSNPSSSDSLSIPLKKSGEDSTKTSSGNLLGGLGGSLGTTIGALVVTLGLFAVFTVFVRRMQKGQQARGLPREAFEVIGETEIGPKQKLLVVRCGVQALIIGVSPAGIQQVAQFDDPDEAGQFIAQCRGLGSAKMFSSALRELEREPSRPGFVEETNSGRGDKGKLFLRA